MKSTELIQQLAIAYQMARMSLRLPKIDQLTLINDIGGFCEENLVDIESLLGADMLVIFTEVLTIQIGVRNHKSHYINPTIH